MSNAGTGNRTARSRYGMIGTVLSLCAAGAVLWAMTNAPNPVRPVPFDQVLGTPSNPQVKQYRPEVSMQMAWTETDSDLIVRQASGTIVRWTPDREQMRPIATTESVFAYCPAENRLLVNMANTAVLLSLDTGAFLRISDRRYDHAAFSQDCSVLAISREDESFVRLWQVGRGWTSVTTDHPVRNSLVLSRDGSVLAASGEAEAPGNGMVLELFDIGSGTTEPTARISGPSIAVGDWSMAFSADGSGVLLASLVLGQTGLKRITSSDGLVRWGRDSADRNWVSALAASPDGILLATGDLDGMLQIWEVDRGVIVAEFDAAQPIESLSFSNDGRRLAVGLWNGTIGIVGADALIGH
ncbi:MAG: hypothetical protein AAF293_08575 [Pseudomonadota bacterium]